ERHADPLIRVIGIVVRRRSVVRGCRRRTSGGTDCNTSSYGTGTIVRAAAVIRSTAVVNSTTTVSTTSYGDIPTRPAHSGTTGTGHRSTTTRPSGSPPRVSGARRRNQ